MRKQKKYHNTNVIRHVARASWVLYNGEVRQKKLTTPQQ
jgi:hypothetical protein